MHGWYAKILRGELPLLCFTLCAPAGAGVALCACMCALASALGAGSGAQLRAGLADGSIVTFAQPGIALVATAFVLTSLGMLASIAHLAKPLRAPFSLRHLRSSWLSREILTVSAFWALLALWLVTLLVGAAGAALVCGVLSACAGGVLIWVIGMAYRFQWQPGWNGNEAFPELAAVGLSLGGTASTAVAGWCARALHGAGQFHAELLTLCLAGMATVFLIAAPLLCRAAHKTRSMRLAELDGSTRVDDVHARLEQLKPARRTQMVWMWIAAGAGALSTVVVSQSLDKLGFALAAPAAWTAVFVIATIGCVWARIGFYGLLTTARSVPRFPQITH